MTKTAKWVTALKHEWEQSSPECSHPLLVNLTVSFGVRLRLLKLAAPSGFFNHFLQPLAFL
jgi:hypothetical protein